MLHLKELLNTHGWTQAQLADLLGRNRSAITHLIQGTRQLKADEVVKIANALHVSYATVLGEAAEESKAISKPKPPKVIAEVEVAKSGIPEPEARLPFLIAPGTMLRKHPAIRYAGDHYIFSASQPVIAADSVFEVQGREVDQLGVIPHDLAFIGPEIQSGDLVLVRYMAHNQQTHGLRLYQPPFLKSFCGVGENFETLHEERANVELLGAVYHVVRLYRG